MHRGLAAAATLSVALLLAACTDDAPQPPPAPSGGPTMPTGVGSHSPSASPSGESEKAIKAAIVRAYTTQFNEFNRLEIKGGAAALSAKLLATTSGIHRKNTLKVLSDDQKSGVHQLGHGRLIGVSVQMGTGSARSITACEDYTNVKWVKHNGQELPADQPIRYLQRGKAKLGTDGRWRIDYLQTTDVKRFKSATCGGGLR